MHTELPNAGFAKLYHPRGPLVTLPVPTDPREAFAHIALCLDVGWLTTAPGLEQGEQREDVGHILRGSSDTTPYLLLYSTNDAHAFSFLKVYLNTAEDITAFENVSGVKLASLPEYVGSDKPERGKNAKIDRFIVRLTGPLQVVFKANPKYSEAASDAARGKGEIYKIPRRLFVRWHTQVSKPKEEKPRDDSTDSRVAQAVKGMDTAPNRENRDAWAKWAKAIPGKTDEHECQLEDAFQRSMERLTPPARPMQRQRAAI